MEKPTGVLAVVLLALTAMPLPQASAANCGFRVTFVDVGLPRCQMTRYHMTRCQIAMDGYHMFLWEGIHFTRFSPEGQVELGAANAYSGLPQLSCSAPAQGALELTITGPPQQECTVEVSPDLVHWTELTTVSLGDGKAHFSQPISGERQFFRAKLISSQ